MTNVEEIFLTSIFNDIETVKIHIFRGKKKFFMGNQALSSAQEKIVYLLSPKKGLK